ncbi:MAG: thioesterase [Bacillota bacterium]|nr:thioesterase [Bacillota bacterium]
MSKLKIGDSLTIQKKVTEKSAALNFGSGRLKKLFATPSLVALMIEATSKLVDDTLEEGMISVGRVATVTHGKPTEIGETITVRVEVTNISGERIDLTMEAFDEIGKIGTGFNERHIVNKKGLLKRAEDREKSLRCLD